jgi:DNA-binding response OmpR family regulator
MAKLLIIEDEPRMVVGLRDNFEYEGYEVITAENDSEGIELALHDSPDLILLDVMFPKITCRELKTKRPTLPVIVLTARYDASDWKMEMSWVPTTASPNRFLSENSQPV